MGKLEKLFNEEERWALENQREAVNNQDEKEVAWHRGYRCALKTLAEKLGVVYKIAG